MTRGSDCAAFGAPVEDLLAVVEHDHAVDHAHQHAHDVLDPDDGDALLARGCAAACRPPAPSRQWSRPLRLSSASSSFGCVASARASSSFFSAAAPRPSVGRARVGRQADQSPAPPRPGASSRRASIAAVLAEPGRRARRSRAASDCGTGAGSGRCGRCPCGRRGSAGSPPISSPAKRDRAARSAHSMPAMQLKIVLLPEPFGPIRPRISPSSTSKETSLTAVKPPNVLVRPETRSMATRTRASARDARGTQRSPDGSLSARRRGPAGSGSTGSMVLIAVGQTILVSPLTYCITTGEERSFCPAIWWPGREELHAVALDGAALGNVGLERRLAQRLGVEAAVLLDRARQHVGEEDPGLVEAHRDVRRHLVRRRSRPCSA